MCTSWPFFAIPGTSGRHGPAHPAWITLVPLGRISSIHFDSEIRNGIRKRAQIPSMPPRIRHDALAAVRSISSQCAICAESDHAINVVASYASERTVGQLIRSLSHSFLSLCSLDRFSGILGLVFKPLLSALTFSSVYGGNRCSMRRPGGEMRNRFRGA